MTGVQTCALPIYAKPKNNDSEELNRLAAKIADQLGKDRAAKK